MAASVRCFSDARVEDMTSRTGGGSCSLGHLRDGPHPTFGRGHWHLRQGRNRADTCHWGTQVSHEYQTLKGKREEKNIISYCQLQKKFGSQQANPNGMCAGEQVQVSRREIDKSAIHAE